MACFIKNVPRNTPIATGNRGIGFPAAATECFFESPRSQCFLSLQESKYVPLLTEQRQRIGISCPIKINDCYFAMQEDSNTSISPQESENSYIKTPCVV